MSVVTVACGGHSAFAFIKGSPEMVASLCQAETGEKLFCFDFDMKYFIDPIEKLLMTVITKA